MEKRHYPASAVRPVRSSIWWSDFYRIICRRNSYDLPAFWGKNEEQLHKALHTAYAFAITGGIIAGVIGVVMTRMVLKWMNTPENLLPDSTLYVRIYFAGLLFIFVYNMGAAILRAIGDSKRPLYFLIVCCIVNIILDLVLVLGFKWESLAWQWQH